MGASAMNILAFDLIRSDLADIPVGSILIPNVYVKDFEFNDLLTTGLVWYLYIGRSSNEELVFLKHSVQRSHSSIYHVHGSIDTSQLDFSGTCIAAHEFSKISP